jgi:hypothetical protein
MCRSSIEFMVILQAFVKLTNIYNTRQIGKEKSQIDQSFITHL